MCNEDKLGQVKVLARNLPPFFQQVSLKGKTYDTDRKING